MHWATSRCCAIIDTTFALVSRAPFAKLEAYRQERGWDVAWYSSFGTDFNYDFHVTNDPKVRPPEYNYRSKAENEAHNSPNGLLGEEHGLSVFFTLDDDVFHTYSAYARGTELFADARLILDATPYGRQQDFEELPARLAAKADIRVGPGRTSSLRHREPRGTTRLAA